ncbi:M48 family metalloprotease [Candidatus Ozemobacteraceae bacterium]|nr:M48 family metalloprotease [Candidatus Ozemobacteraceae bacterium]
MNRFIFALLIVILSGSFTSARGADEGRFQLEKLRDLLPASGSIRLSPGKESRQQLLQRVRNRLPDNVRAVGDALQKVSPEHEIAIGRQIAGNLLGAAPLVDDAGLQQYVNRVGRWVAEQCERSDLPWHFGVIESADVNAFAAPGGYIFVTRGLYALLRDEAELAGVLAHEIGHVIRRHHLEILQKSRLLDLGRQALPGKITDNASVQQLIGHGAEIVARSLDQKAEFEADRIAVVLAARAGYDAFGLPSVLQLIGHYARDDDKVALLFKTHPHPDARLEKLDARIGSGFDHLKGLTLPNRLYRLKPVRKK